MRSRTCSHWASRRGRPSARGRIVQKGIWVHGRRGDIRGGDSNTLLDFQVVEGVCVVECVGGRERALVFYRVHGRVELGLGRVSAIEPIRVLSEQELLSVQVAVDVALVGIVLGDAAIVGAGNGWNCG